MCKYFFVSHKRKMYTSHGWINSIGDITKINKLINIHTRDFYSFFYFFCLSLLNLYRRNIWFPTKSEELNFGSLCCCLFAFTLYATQSTEMCIQYTTFYLLYIQFHHIWFVGVFFEMLNKLLSILFSHLALSIHLIDFSSSLEASGLLGNYRFFRILTVTLEQKQSEFCTIWPESGQKSVKIWWLFPWS